jgi:hypothetical protein
MQFYNDLSPYFGDLHSHCAVGYGHGGLADAFQNAQLQLDFAAVTVHAHWPDIPAGEQRLADLVDYHQEGFQKSRQGWDHLRDMVAANHRPGQFIPFLGFEWHSNQYGDHNVYFKDPHGAIIPAGSLREMRQALRHWQEQGVDALAIPHHIGYKRGYRGINWEAFDPAFSPVVEIISMHGCSESPDAPYPYLHTMGPRDWRSTYHYGLAQGHVVGAIGSTDHHSAHPGSYGHGRMAVWSQALSREAVWDAIKARRTYALTGDKIALAFSINDGLMGAILPPAPERHICCQVRGGGAIDYVDVLHNNRIIHRTSSYEKLLAKQVDPFAGPLKIYLELGWGQKGENVDWQANLQVVEGELLDVEPRFRGHNVVAPQAGEEESYAFSNWERGGDGVAFATRTWGNPTTTTAATQGIAFEISADADTTIRGQINGQDVNVSLSDLIQGPKSSYLGGFLTPAFYFHRAIPQTEYTAELDFVHQPARKDSRDWYTVRVRQHNGQWAWSSPIWVETSAS